MFRRFFRKSNLDEEIAEELEAHLEIEIKQLMDRGLQRGDAERLARQSFGNRTGIAETTRAAWRWIWLDQLSQDLRYALRSLRQNPVFTLSAVASLALGIGAGTAVFSIADTIFLLPLPYTEAKELVWVAVRFPGLSNEFLASPDYVAWRRENQVFSQLAATQGRGGETMLLNGPQAREVHAVKVSSNFLSTFGTRVAIGRDFTAQEELPNGPRAVLLSHELWLHRYRADKSIAGRSIRLNGDPYVVAGVLPASFVYPMDVPVDVMTTLPVPPTASHHDQTMMTWAVYGRLRPGVTVAQARNDLERLFAISKADIPLMFRSDSRLVVEPLQQHRRGDAGLVLAILVGAVACLLLIACANVSNLLLARWSARSGEFAIRAAIGAGRARLTRQLVTETLLLTAAGCILATGLVVVIVQAFRHYALSGLPRLSEIAIDSRVLVVGMIVALLTAAIFGALPVLRAGRVDMQSVLQESTRLSRGRRAQLLRRALVVAEISLSLVLLCGSSLLLETLWHLRNDHLGFQSEHVFMMSIPVKGTRLGGANQSQMIDDLIDFARRVPGTTGAAVTECSPLSGGPLGVTFSRSDRALPEAFHRGDGVHVCGTGSDYVKAAGARILRGRFFQDADRSHANTLAVINETTARTYFPGEDPIAKQIIGGPQKKWKTIVGVISDTKNQGLNAKPAAQVFVNGTTWPDSSEIQIMVRSNADPQQVQSALAGKLRSLDAGAIAKYQSLNQAISEMAAGPRFNGLLVGSFAVIAFLMAIVGVYGVLAFLVTQRTQEIGIRAALGAEPKRMFALVVREGAVLVLSGIAIGLAITSFLMSYLKTMLYGVAPTDPLTLSLVALGLMLAAGMATALPARRASLVDPAISLRHA